MIYVIYFLFIVIILILLTLAFFKLKQPFWSRQPVFHLYNLSYWFLSSGIIQNENVTENSRFFDNSIVHRYSHQLSVEDKLKLVSFIKDNFVTINEDGVDYYPTLNNIFSYLNNKSIISTKYKDSNTKTDIIGCITGRSLFCYLENNEQFYLNYVDYLCVHKEERKIGIAPKLIYSYYHNQRETTGNQICLFKKEGSLTSIIPLCTYFSYGLFLSDYNPPKIVSVEKIKNTQILYNNIPLLKKKFECIILPPINDFIAMNDIHIYGIVNLHKIYCLFFFRNTYTKIDGVEVIDCFASVNNTDVDTFYHSFMGCIMNNFKNKFLIIEDISDNSILIKYLVKFFNIKFKSNTGYYFYNYAMRPKLSNKTFIII
jgi:hypothetical protein